MYKTCTHHVSQSKSMIIITRVSNHVYRTGCMEKQETKTETEGGNGKQKRKAEKHIVPIHCFLYMCDI